MSSETSHLLEKEEEERGLSSELLLQEKKTALAEAQREVIMEIQELTDELMDIANEH